MTPRSSVEIGSLSLARSDPARRADWITPEDVAANALAGNGALKVGIVGGGIAGLTAAYILRHLGIRFDLYEASHRLGGRVWTLRDGDSLQDSRDHPHHVRLPTDEYVEAGAARIHPHMLAMDYARRLNIRLEPFVASNPDALLRLRDERGSTTVRIRDLQQDLLSWLAGHLGPSHSDIVELLAQSNSAMQTGTRTRRSLQNLEDAGDPRGRVAQAPTEWRAVEFIRQPAGQAFWADTSTLKSGILLRAADGADAVTQALESALPSGSIHPSHELIDIRQRPRDVAMQFRSDRGTLTRTFDLVILAAPPHLLSRVPGNWHSDVLRSLTVPEPRPAVKGFISYRRRWWEQDLGIVGGTSYLGSDAQRLWYPASAIGTNSGTLTAYSLKEGAQRLGRMAPDQLERVLVDDIATLHGVEHSRDVTSFSSVSWADVPHIEGAWVNWPDGSGSAYERLRQGWDRVAFAGDWLSPLTAWQAGAFESAGHATNQLLGKEHRA